MGREPRPRGNSGDGLLGRRAFCHRVAGGAGVALAVGATGVLAGCLSGPPEAVTVEMTDDLRFEPADATVATGGTVTWENVGTVPHTVTAEDGAIPTDATYFASGGFDSESAARENLQAGYVDEGERYRHRFETTGTYEYLCIPHEGSGMVGTLDVE